MLRNQLYYSIKPLVPLAIRRRVRRWFALRQRSRVSQSWPILPGSERPPEGWPGWPDGKKFAFVLTHDVEGQAGLDKCRQLMEMEKQRGFRSSFNFVPEGEYRVSKELRDDLTRSGFEVGVHDLHHDGKLYQGAGQFAHKAARINQHIKEWGVAGFRSAFMLHKLPWLHDLDIQYDASTFDTDPFEPQPDGAGTIFPFWQAGPRGGGYAELPYTLPQDSTLYLLFGERNTDIWRHKLDWIAGHGGMALVNVHPDYLCFDGARGGSTTFPAAYYEQLLDYARSKYGGAMWEALPREVASFVAAQARRIPPALPRAGKGRKIWIDLDNTPHVPLFAPIIAELNRRGYEVLLTARDAFQVCELAEKKGMKCLKIGRHSGRNKVRKAAGLFCRAAQLAPVALREKPVIGLSHGSRSQILICNVLGIPTVMMDDYEFSRTPSLVRPSWFIAPEVIPNAALPCRDSRIRKYPGTKEDVYVPEFKEDPAFLESLGLNGRDLIVAARPPATEAHYHNSDAEGLFGRFMDRACRTDGVRVVLLPRNKNQGRALLGQFPHWFKDNRTVIPEGAVDGLNLIWHSDLVVSGGGTMNREAAALGVPVYSVFRGKIGAVDRDLQRQGRLTLVENAEDADRIALRRRARAALHGPASSAALARIVDHVVEIVEMNSRD
jgi:predicted glycosyltransferase